MAPDSVRLSASQYYKSRARYQPGPMPVPAQRLTKKPLAPIGPMGGGLGGGGVQGVGVGVGAGGGGGFGGAGGRFGGEGMGVFGGSLWSTQRDSPLQNTTQKHAPMFEAGDSKPLANKAHGYMPSVPQSNKRFPGMLVLFTSSFKFSRKILFSAIRNLHQNDYSSCYLLITY